MCAEAAELRVLNILSEANKETKRGGDGDAFKESALHTLELNINKRYVKQGNFKVLFDQKRNPEPVKLNKDHAVTMMAFLMFYTMLSRKDQSSFHFQKL